MFIKCLRVLSLFLIFSLILAGCSQIDEDAVKEHSTTFSPGNIPDQLLEDVENKRAVIVGEVHGSKEHQYILADFVKALHNNGELDAVILDARHAFGWIIEDYTRGAIEEGVYVRDVLSRRWEFFQKIREYNEDLPEEEKLIIRAGDINFHHDQFLTSLQYMRNYIEEREALNMFLNRLRTSVDRESVLREFKNDLEEKDIFTGTGPADWDERILRIIEVELKSREPREKWQTNYSEAHRMREEVLKDIVSYELNDGHEIVLNYGFNHAQKRHHFGTEKKWLGEYLTQNHPLSSNRTFSLVFVPLKGRLNTGEGQVEEINLLEDPPDNDLISTAARIIGSDSYSYLFLDERAFGENEVKMRFPWQTVEAVPKEIYDGFIFIPEVTPGN